jgi:hypothetical protein
VAVFGAANTTFKGNLLPAANVIYDLGSATQAWNDLYLSGNTVYLNNATITSNATALTFTNQAGGSFVLAGTGQAGSNAISNGNSNVNIATANGNVTIAAAGNTTMTVTGTGVNVAGTLNATGVITGNGSGLSALTGANVTGTVPLSSVAGTVSTAAQPNITSLGTLTGLSVVGVANLSSNANVKISGGSNGQFLQTDGNGNLAWATGGTGTGNAITNGNTSVSIPTAGNSVFMGEVGTYEGVRIVINNHLTNQGRGYLMGAEALAKAYSTAPGFGPQPKTVVAPVVDKLKRFASVGWYHLVGYSVFRAEALLHIKTDAGLFSE